MSKPSVDVPTRLVLGLAVTETKVVVARDVSGRLDVSAVPVGESGVFVETKANVRAEEDVLDIDRVVVDNIRSL